MYIWMRRTGHVGDLQAAILVWVTLLSFTPRFLNVPDADNAAWSILIAMTGVFLWIPKLPAFLAACFTYTLLAQWNVAHATKEPEKLLVLPGSFSDKTGFQVFTENMAPTLFVAFTIITFAFIIVESERRGAAQKAANEMTLRILKHQRKYDTAQIATVIKDCKAEGVVENALLELYDTMNANLESYRPFLPNYLFNSDDDGESLEGDGNEDNNNLGPESRSGKDDEEECDDEGSIAMADPEGESGHRYQSKTPVPPSSSFSDHSSNRSFRDHHSATGETRHHHPTTLIKRGALFNGRVTFALVDVRVDRLMPSMPDEGAVRPSDVLRAVTHKIYSLAKETKASVHSMLGDTVQLTWNATQPVALPETKGAVFLARLAEQLHAGVEAIQPLNGTTRLNGGGVRGENTSNDDGTETALLAAQHSTPMPPLTISAAICSGKSAVHRITTHHQQALIIEALWLPVLEGCFELAKRSSATATPAIHRNSDSSSYCHLRPQGAVVCLAG
jgi:hypothetical protein